MATFLTFFHPTFYPVFLPPLFQVFPEAESVVVAELSPEVVSAAAELSLEVVVLAVEPEVFALVFVVAELFPEVVVLAAELEVSEPGVFFVAVVSVAHVAEPQASVDIAVAFHVSVPVSVVVAEVYSSGHPKFFAFPNVDPFANCSSSVEVVGEESVHSSTDARTNYDLCSILSNLGLHQNKNLEHCYNNPNPGYNNVNDTNDLPKIATTNHSRKRSLHQCQGQRKHTSQVSLLTLVVRQIRWVAAEEN
jgi:hypothetical protein